MVGRQVAVRVGGLEDLTRWEISVGKFMGLDERDHVGERVERKGKVPGLGTAQQRRPGKVSQWRPRLLGGCAVCAEVKGGAVFSGERVVSCTGSSWEVHWNRLEKYLLGWGKGSRLRRDLERCFLALGKACPTPVGGSLPPWWERQEGRWGGARWGKGVCVLPWNVSYVNDFDKGPKVIHTRWVHTVFLLAWSRS